MISPEEMPALAADALEADLDGRPIRRMAALNNPSGWDVDQVLPGFMEEAGLSLIATGEAALRIARDLARRILQKGSDPLAYAREFEAILIRSDYASEIRAVGNLDDDQYAAEAMGRTEDAFRKFARGVLIALVERAIPSKPDQD
ncbi:MAG TPA: hypothetical protein VHX60_19100 [Acidobacteriaceae bacterium]|nr:hypothetical protein [Acidobacteriaceae bacterium]